MITKTDWKKFVQRVYKVNQTFTKAKFDGWSSARMTIGDNPIIYVDLERLEITAINRKGDGDGEPYYITYSHPASFQNNPDFQRLKNSVKVECDIHGLADIEKVFKTK